MTILFSASALGFFDADHPAPPADAVEISDELHAELLAGQAAGRVISVDAGAPVLVDRPAPTAAELKAGLTAVVQRHLDAQALAMGYDSLASAASYADEPVVLRFQAEGRALRAWRSLVWARCIEILGEVTSGSRPVPTAQQLLAALPTFAAP